MIEKYKTPYQEYSLIEDVVRDNFSDKDKEYAAKASQYIAVNDKPVFYFLKHIKDGFIDYAQYFIIPVTAEEIESINRTYSYNHLIGIAYPNRFMQTFTPPKGMTGHDYEYECADILRKRGFINVEVTKGSGDQGIDVIAVKDNLRYGIQCKYYENPVSNKAVQEAHAGADYYGCDVAVVMTNSTFTNSAVDLAHRTGVKLWSSNNNYKEV